MADLAQWSKRTAQSKKREGLKVLATGVDRGFFARMTCGVGNLEMVEVALHVERRELIYVTVTGPLGKERERPVVQVDGGLLATPPFQIRFEA
jgi:hypothetical protein